jgi:hypothetical protein
MFTHPGILKLRNLMEFFIIKYLYFMCTFLASRRVKWSGHVARMGERTDVYRVLVGKPGRMRPLERTRRRWEDNIKMDLQKLGCGVWTGLSWLRIETGGEHL